MNNRRTTFTLVGVAFAMFAFGFALVPLYGLICDVTGLQRAGGVGRAEAAAGSDTSRSVTVRFDATVDRSLPWAFEPVERSRTLHPGERAQVKFRVKNLTSRTITGQAIPSVTPWQAGPYFSKMECFCFSEQTLAGGEEVEMPLIFTVSSELPSEITSLTLSYTFMGLPDQRARKDAF